MNWGRAGLWTLGAGVAFMAGVLVGHSYARPMVAPYCVMVDP